MTHVPGCELCERVESPAWQVIAQGARLRVTRVLDMPAFPAYYRVIWNDHVRELSELATGDRARCMDTVVEVERQIVRGLGPAKVNLASLGNLVPHLHWHVIARFAWDTHFPQPIWGAAQRSTDPAALTALGERLSDVDAAVRGAVATLLD